MISGESIVYFGPEAWKSMWRNRHHLLSRLAQANRVVYVEPRPYVEEVLAAPRQRPAPALRRTAEGVWVYTPPRWAPLGGPPPLRAITHIVRRAHLNGALGRISVRRPILFLSTPTQFDARADMPARLRVYHIVDEYLGYNDLPAAHRAAFARKEQALIRWADLVVVVSQALLETKGQGDPKFRLLPNAVDDAAYRGAVGEPPPALRHLRRPLLGYVGLISARLDLDLLDELARRYPERSFVLLGTVYRSGCETLLDRLAARPNVHLLEPVSGAEVAQYVRHFDVGLAPYRVTAETMHASPLKIYEYLAAGLPVVAAAVPGATGFGSAVDVAAGAGEWAAALDRALAPESRSAEAAVARQQAVTGHTWPARVEALSGMLREALAAVQTGARR